MVSILTSPISDKLFFSFFPNYAGNEKRVRTFKSDPLTTEQALGYVQYLLAFLKQW